MKKLLNLLFAVLLVFSVSACGSNSDKDLLETIKEKGEIVIASEGDWSPYTYHDETTNELVGFDVELGQLIAEKLGVKFVSQETDFDSILAGVQSGRFDLGINGITYTEERAQSFNFSEPYAQMDAVLIVSKDNTDITSFEDLNGKIATNSVGSIYAETSESYGATVIYAPKFEETMANIIKGDADASINAISAYNDYERAKQEAGEELQVKIVAYAEPEKYVVAAKKDASTESLINEVNNIIDELRADGTLAALSEKYFGFDATQISE